ncbi:hypothetical protein ABB55_03615 [Prosthecomicrobium hirschii]|uniref:Uncharacterized protein n=2 Tax=Prosthecodimorpha hirschii TaxID=665126 RepID=A0A0P6WAB1_9HYPH|nr:hypothetical protein ABB55_03615 [Prosthecomicrobium hirschii]
MPEPVVPLSSARRATSGLPEPVAPLSPAQRADSGLPEPVAPLSPAQRADSGLPEPVAPLSPAQRADSGLPEPVAPLSPAQRVALAAAAATPLHAYRRGYAAGRSGPFFRHATIAALTARGLLMLSPAGAVCRVTSAGFARLRDIRTRARRSAWAWPAGEEAAAGEAFDDRGAGRQRKGGRGADGAAP